MNRNVNAGTSEGKSDEGESGDVADEEVIDSDEKEKRSVDDRQTNMKRRVEIS